MARGEAAIAFISTVDIPMPSPEERAKARGRGGNKTVYDFGNLPVGKSIAVTNRTAKQLNTTISTANNAKSKLFVLDDKGKPVMVPKLDDNGAPVKGSDGKVVMTEKLRKFFAIDCDPATDPEKATARIWREQ